ncbi:probable LRR receptor-like serine/threonine-protein kinase At1g05700 isoform X2 [Musa acuminata AAA Group]|uniref:probable LRR receptor-like serine/threonine-protein kinase At1g05700 isoform X2 n=1 Tax=Musa acuminata AAA Group TaxID=214697 RepID=UPI0031E44FC6
MAKHLKTSLLLLLPLLPLLVATVSAVFLSIDCGSSESFIDESNIKWVGDNSYIGHGRSFVFRNRGLLSRAMTTLRVFESRRKSCYRIDVSGGGRVLVRASFNYGNYDGKSFPPSFGLQFGANDWDTVVTSLDQPVSHEAIYVVSGDATSVCVALTLTNQFPFVSTIEVRSLEWSMYAHVDPSRALFLRRREAFGAQQIVRYEDDVYDRIWTPSIISNGLTVLASDTSFNVAALKDKPPALVLQTAVAPTQLSSLSIPLAYLSTSTVPIYVNMYFSEMSELEATQMRSFEIYVDGVHVSAPVSPPYQDFIELSFANITANSNTAIELRPTADSTLPPIISAMEVFLVSAALSNGTNADDVNALGTLQRQFKVLRDWNGDPCLPFSYNWEWVRCSSDERPRITELNLSGFGLTGVLPNFGALTALETVDLHDNSLSGEIPDFLGNLPNLRKLNLAYNNFSGSIPSSLTQNTKLDLQVSGNQDLRCSGRSCSGFAERTRGSDSSWERQKGGKGKVLVLGLVLRFALVVGLPFGIVFGAVVLFVHYHRRMNREDASPLRATPG